MKVEREEVGKDQDTILPVLRMGGIQNPKINLKEKSRARIYRSASIAEVSKSGKRIVKFIENFSKEHNTGFTYSQHKKEIWQTESKSPLCISPRWKNTLLKLSKKMKKRIERKKNNLHRSKKMPLRNREDISDVEL